MINYKQEKRFANNKQMTYSFRGAIIISIFTLHWISLELWPFCDVYHRFSLCILGKERHFSIFSFNEIYMDLFNLNTFNSLEKCSHTNDFLDDFNMSVNYCQKLCVFNRIVLNCNEFFFYLNFQIIKWNPPK